MSIKVIILLLFHSVIVASCAVHSGNVSSGSLIDCKWKDVVSGEASTRRILGCGGLNKNSLILEAKRDLYTKFNQNKTIKLTNFSVDFKTTHYLFFYTTQLVTVSADLYDCSQPWADDPKNIIPPIVGGIKSGDSIIYEYKRFYPGIFNFITKSGRCDIVFMNNNGAIITHKVKQSSIFKTTLHPDNKIYFGYNIGDTKFIEVYQKSIDKKVLKPCKIIGLNNRRLLISYIKEDGKERWLSVDKSLIKE